jgi:hypothetical protein
MATRANVQSLLSGDLGQWLEGQVATRAAAKAKAHKRWTISACVLLPILAFLWFGPNWGTDFKGIISVIGCGAGFAWGNAPIVAAKKQIKVGINSAIAGALGLNYSCDLQPGGEWDRACDFGLIPSFDRSRFEDEWSGQLGGRDFCLYEAHCEEERGSGKDRRWVTVFRGAIIRIAPPRPFHAVTLLQRAGKHKSFFGLGGRKDSIKLGGMELGFVDMVLPQFEDVFEMWSTDQVEARWLADPAYIERLVALEQAFAGKNVRTLWIDGALVVAIETGDMFESGSINPEDDAAKVAQCNEQFGTLADLAETLNKQR